MFLESLFAGPRSLDSSSANDTALQAGIITSFEETDRRLNNRIRLLAISSKTRRFYQLYCWKGRYRTLRHWLYVVSFLNFISGLVDYFAIDLASFRKDIVGRVIISVSLICGGLVLRRLRRLEIEGLSVVAPCIIILVTTGIIGLRTSPEFLERHMVNTWFVIGSGIVFLRLDFVHTCILALASLMIGPAFVIVSDIHPAWEKVDIILFHCCAMLALLNAQRIQVVHRYKGILLSLKNEQLAQRLSEQTQHLKDLAATDQLTAIANRRCFNETCAALPRDLPIAVVMLDIDNFKSLNDRMGHIEGDRAICMVARAISEATRTNDLVARYGGEEFVILSRQVGGDQAALLAEQVRMAVAALPAISGHVLTVSAGVASGYGADQAAVLHAADAALYDAKRRGRNCVVLAGALAAAPLPADTSVSNAA